jgi:hypothetical protein
MFGRLHLNIYFLESKPTAPSFLAAFDPPLCRAPPFSMQSASSIFRTSQPVTIPAEPVMAAFHFNGWSHTRTGRSSAGKSLAQTDTSHARKIVKHCGYTRWLYEVRSRYRSRYNLSKCALSSSFPFPLNYPGAAFPPIPPPPDTRHLHFHLCICKIRRDNKYKKSRKRNPRRLTLQGNRTRNPHQVFTPASRDFSCAAGKFNWHMNHSSFGASHCAMLLFRSSFQTFPVVWDVSAVGLTKATNKLFYGRGEV